MTVEIEHYITLDANPATESDILMATANLTSRISSETSTNPDILVEGTGEPPKAPGGLILWDTFDISIELADHMHDEDNPENVDGIVWFDEPRHVLTGSVIAVTKAELEAA